MGNELTLTDNYERIARIVNGLRNHKLSAGIELSDKDKAVINEIQNLTATIMGDDPTFRRGRDTYPEFTLQDAVDLVREIADNILADPEHRTYYDRFVTVDGERLTAQQGMMEHVGKNLLVDFTEDPQTKRINRTIPDLLDRDEIERSFSSDPFYKEITQYEDAIWSDARYVLKDEYLAATLWEAKREPYGLMDENTAKHIALAEIAETEEISDAFVETWVTTWEQNLPLLKEYLQTGRVRDDQDNLTINVSGWNENNIEESIVALLDYDMANVGRYETGQAIIPQYANTVTDRKRAEIASKAIEWGWNKDKSIKENVQDIMNTYGIDPNDKSTIKDGNHRWAMGYTQREDVIKVIEDRMFDSIHNPGSTEYNTEAVALMMDIVGTDFGKFNASTLQRFNEISQEEWNILDRSGRDNALNKVLDRFGYVKTDLTEDAYKNLSANMDQFRSFGAALEDYEFESSIDSAAAAQGVITAADQRAKLNNRNTLMSAVKQSLRTTGVISESTTPDFENQLDSTTIPEIVRRITNMGGVDTPEELARIVAEMTDIGNLGPGEDQLPAYLVREEDFRRQFMGSSKTPHAIPRDFTDPATGKTYLLPEFTVGSPKELEFQFDPDFITEEVQDLALERPEFASFITQELKKPDFMTAWKKASQPTFDAERFESKRGGVAGRAAAELARIDQEIARRKRAMGQDVPAGALQGATEAIQQREIDRLEEQRKQQEFFAGAGFARQVKFQAMTPGQTTEEFFATQLPGFEQRYKDSAYFKQEELRLEQEAEQQAAREDRERRTRTERRQRERQALLRSGTGQGRGLSVFRRRES